jgi:protein-L-isoaspartate(D-aspartate) O-methyltransferase
LTVDTAAQRLLELIHQRALVPIPDRVAEAFLAVPRHHFVPEDQLSDAYRDMPVTLVQGSADRPTSTISQPSLVLAMLALADVQPGHRVLEIGAASGWNAAMLGHLTGPEGRVTAVEILPELAAQAQARVQAHLQASQVSVVAGDGGGGWPEHAPYDRVIYTASAPDLPVALRAQVVDGGRVLLVLSISPDMDCLLALDKQGEQWRSARVHFCRFVPLTGAWGGSRAAPTPEALLEGLGPPSLVATDPCWFGADTEEAASWASAGLRMFLALTEPGYRPVRRGFALIEGSQVVLAQHGELRSYGGLLARDRLLRAMARWATSGMPAASAWSVTIGADEGFAMVRPETTFRWRLTR